MRDFVKFSFSHFLSLWLRKCQETSSRYILTQSANRERWKEEERRKEFIKWIRNIFTFFFGGLKWVRIKNKKVGDDKKSVLCALLSERRKRDNKKYTVCIFIQGYLLIGFLSSEKWLVYR
jgi:hypothetical protein